MMNKNQYWIELNCVKLFNKKGKVDNFDFHNESTSLKGEYELTEIS